MITKNGYSKDPFILPEGIVVTFGKDMITSHGGLKGFLKYFNAVMDDHEGGNYWMHKCKNGPTHDIIHVYIVVANRLYGRCYYGGYFKNSGKMAGRADGSSLWIDWPYIVLCGPLERTPFKRELKGFQGFRYCTNLF